MPLSNKLDRKLRAAEDSSDDEEYYEVTDRSSPSVIDTGEGADILSDSEDEGNVDEGAVSIILWKTRQYLTLESQTGQMTTTSNDS
jgi:hypothetical protein